MANNHLTATYWNNRYCTNNIPWDIGYVAPIFIKKFKELSVNKDLHILIPGAGSAHEAIYLHQKGFKNVWVCDWAEEAFSNLRASCPDFPEAHLLIKDFFHLDLQVDLIVEQTFFCAIHPTQRLEYIQKAAEILTTGGKLMGLLFATEFDKNGPPYGGNEEEYFRLFSSHFDILTLEKSKESIQPRLGNELYLELKKND